jgi:menaquinone-specific isochorismate synthase
MGSRKVPAGSNDQERRVAAVSASVEGVSPDVLLGLEPDGPRGFWAREGRWFAHLGAAATVEVIDPSCGKDRFRHVWDGARKLFACSWRDPESEVQPPSPRLFGGFAFQDAHLAEGAWEGFPSARFILPEVELVGGEGKGVLTCRSFLDPWEDPAKCRERLRGRLARVKAALEAPRPGPPEGEMWIPATRVETEPEVWNETVDRALEEMERGGVSKVVLARVQTVSAEEGLEPVDVAMNLWRDNPGAHVFLFEPVPEHVFLGAAPETVATVASGHFRATAVAGSVARGETEAQQKAFARDLRRSSKDRREHEMCVEDMLDRLRPISERVSAQAEPHVLTLSHIQHLETVIQASLRPDQTVLSVLQALHPTPAVCGLPRDPSLDFLRREERFQRGWYAGPVGWFDGDGNGVFVPALRSAVGRGREWRLFAGAGIVVGSDPRREWDETRIKFQPVLRALALARAGRAEPLVSGSEEA